MALFNRLFHRNKNTRGLKIKRGTLVKYKGKGGKVIIPDSVTAIGCEAFFLRSLQSIVIPSSVTSIGKEAFWGCKSLKSIEIQPGVRSIGESAFAWCESLKSIEIQPGVESIGAWAFYECNSLKSISIPSSVTKIGKGILASCNNLNHIEVAKDNLYYYSENNCIIEKQSKTLIAGCNASIIPEDVKDIGECAFWECTLMQIIEIPSGVRSIGEDAFYKCNSLKSIEIPSSVQSCGRNVFEGCESLKRATLPTWFEGTNAAKKLEEYGCRITYKDIEITHAKNKSSVNTPPTNPQEKINTNDFEIKSILVKYKGEGDKVSIPNGVKNIGDEAFSGCKSLKSVEIPSSVTSIGVCAFGGCETLNNISIPSSVVNIRYGAFRDCVSLDKITLPSRFKGQEDRLGIRKECEITYLDDDDDIIYSKN